MRLFPQTIILRFPKISSAFALKFLTAAPYPARFFRHWRRFAGYAHQGETPSNAVQNEFRTMRAKRSWGRSTGQRLPPRSEAFSHDRSHRRAVIARRNINRRERRPRRSVSKRVNNFAKAGAYFPSLRLCINLTRYALCRKGQRTSGGRFAHFDRL